MSESCVVITGASGLLGRAVLKTFLKHGAWDRVLGTAFSRQRLFKVKRFQTRVARWFLRVARFFFVQHTKTGKNIPNYRKIYQISIKCSKWL
jgi:nucleoside-diphosphate-sugar epimerase